MRCHCVVVSRHVSATWRGFRDADSKGISLTFPDLSLKHSNCYVNHAHKIRHFCGFVAPLATFKSVYRFQAPLQKSISHIVNAKSIRKFIQLSIQKNPSIGDSLRCIKRSCKSLAESTQQVIRKSNISHTDVAHAKRRSTGSVIVV